MTGIPIKNRKIVKEEIATVIIDEINKYLDRSESPVLNGEFKKDKKDGSPSQLFDTGEMRNHIDWKDHREGIKIGVFDDEEAEKAHGHHSDPRGILPKREFIPRPSGTFKDEIMEKVVDVINQFREEGKSKEFEPTIKLTDLKIKLD